ncbi:hypothetical protein KQI84_14610 [bacterium]|nr:hypothetical protein [bacterium]
MKMLTAITLALVFLTGCASIESAKEPRTTVTFKDAYLLSQGGQEDHAKLFALLESEDVEARESAAFAIRFLDEIPCDVFERLVLMGKGNGEGRLPEVIVSTLAALTPSHMQCVHEVLAQEPALENFEIALLAALFSKSSPDTQRAIETWLDDPSPAVRASALFALVMSDRISPARSRYIARSLLQNDNERVAETARMLWAYGTQQIGVSESDIIEIEQAVPVEVEPWGGEGASPILSLWAKDSLFVLEAMFEDVETGDEASRKQAIQCLEGLTRLPDGSDEVLLRYLSSTDEECRRLAVNLAGQTSIPVGSPLEEALVTALRDSSSTVRLRAAITLSELDRVDDQRLEEIKAAFDQAVSEEERIEFALGVNRLMWEYFDAFERAVDAAGDPGDPHCREAHDLLFTPRMERIREQLGDPEGFFAWKDLEGNRIADALARQEFVKSTSEDTPTSIGFKAFCDLATGEAARRDELYRLLREGDQRSQFYATVAVFYVQDLPCDVFESLLRIEEEDSLSRQSVFLSAAMIATNRLNCLRDCLSRRDSDGFWTTVFVAIRAVKLRPNALEAMKLYIKDQDPYVRGRALLVLAASGVVAPEELRLLSQPMMADEDPEVLELATELGIQRLAHGGCGEGHLCAATSN